MLKNRKKLFLFQRWKRSVGIDEAVITHWIKLPPGTLEELTFKDWVQIFKSAPFKHPAKQKSLDWIKEMATSFPQSQTYYSCLGTFHTSRMVHENKKL
jgi:hypothetical protein